MSTPTLARVHPCVDCAALPTLHGQPAGYEGPCQPIAPRPAPHGGPRSRRCHTHYRAWRKAVAVKVHASRVQRVYGLAPGEYDAVKAQQGGRCAICRIATGARRRLAVDHDHDTGEPRGLLCGPCNKIILGYGGELLTRAVTYLADPPVARLRRERNAA